MKTTKKAKKPYLLSHKERKAVQRAIRLIEEANGVLTDVTMSADERMVPMSVVNRIERTADAAWDAMWACERLLDLRTSR